MPRTSARFRLVRHTLLSLLLCLLVILSLLVYQVAPSTAARGVDLSFQDPPLIGPRGSVAACAIQPDSKIVIAGSFDNVNGVARTYIARLNADGSLDSTFAAPPIYVATVHALVLQPDGKVLIAGFFLFINGDTTPIYHVARLNADGSLDSAFAPTVISSTSGQGEISAVALQADGKVIIGGNFTTVNDVPRNGIARLHADGSLDATFAPSGGVNGPSRGTTVSTTLVQSNGQILIAGEFTTVNGASRNGIARLNADGSLDPTFAPSSGVDGRVSDMELQADGKVMIGGSFTTVNGASRNGMARLNADGSLDATFAPSGGADSMVSTLTLQKNGQILIGGEFTTVNGVPQNRMARLNADGSRDPTFTLAEAPDRILALVVQADGKIIVGGDFTTSDNLLRSRLVRLHADSSLDPTFTARVSGWSDVESMTLQANGKLIIGGDFVIVDAGGRRYQNIARLNADGSLDPTFGPTSGANGRIRDVVVQADGKIVIGGKFTTVNGASRNGMARLNADGSLDSAFAPTVISSTSGQGEISAVALQADGKVIIGGNFTTVNDVPRNGMARLHADGSLDSTFAPIISFTHDHFKKLNAVALQADGQILIAGDFTTVNGASRNGMARLNADGSLDPTFAPSGGADSMVFTLTLQADGKILIGGSFPRGTGEERDSLARLNTDGSRDTAFVPIQLAAAGPQAFAVQPDGKIIVGSQRLSINYRLTPALLRLNADGSLDPTFADTGRVGGHVRAIALQSDGKIVIAGAFDMVLGVPRQNVARLHNVYGTSEPQATQ